MLRLDDGSGGSPAGNAAQDGTAAGEEEADLPAPEGDASDADHPSFAVEGRIGRVSSSGSMHLVGSLRPDQGHLHGGFGFVNGDDLQGVTAGVGGDAWMNGRPPRPLNKPMLGLGHKRMESVDSFTSHASGYGMLCGIIVITASIQFLYSRFDQK
jgi:hypothetical protein